MTPLELAQERLKDAEARFNVADAALDEAREHGTERQYADAWAARSAIGKERDKYRAEVSKLTPPDRDSAPRAPTYDDLWTAYAEPCTRALIPAYGKWQSDKEAVNAYLNAKKAPPEPEIPYYRDARAIPLDAKARIGWVIEHVGRGLLPVSGVGRAVGYWQLVRDTLGVEGNLVDRHVPEQPSLDGEELSKIVHACRHPDGPAMRRAEALAGRPYNHAETLAKLRGWPTQPAPQLATGRTPR
jgi:hypothetical protein